MEERENLLRILTETKQAFLANDSYKLKILSDQTINSAAIYQDSDNIIVAVIVYSLGKIVERESYSRVEGWDNFYKSLLKYLTSAINYLQENNQDKFLDSLGLIRETVTNIEGNLSTYIKDIFYKAGINKAFKLYEHGLSSGKTAELLGVSLWDLAGYIGQSTVSESHLNEALPIKKRIESVRQISKIKNIILDSGPLISMTLTGTLYILERLKKNFPEIEFIMTPQVKEETIGKAWTVKKYELEAVKLETLISKGVIKLATDFMSANQIEKETSRLLKIANNIYKAQGEFLQLIQLGEASCLAFASICNCKNMIVADERTVRLLSESPVNLKAITERKLHTNVTMNPKSLKEFSKFNFIRSSELLFLAYELGLLDYKKEKRVLDALLYAVKYSGTSISSKEIEEMKNFVK